MPDLPVDPPPDDDEPPQVCEGCGLPLGEPHGCACERVEVWVLKKLEDTSS